MVVDDRSRHELYSRLEEVLGQEAATTLIEHLPPVGWADVATRHDLAGMEARMDLRFHRVDESIRAAASDLQATFEHELRMQTTTIGQEMRAQSTTFGQEMRAQSTTFGQEMRALTTTMIIALVTAVLTMAGLAFALARFT